MIAERVAQIVEKQRLERDALDQARFARRHLRDDRGEDGVAPPRDRGHLHEGVVLLQIDVAVRLAERRLGLEIFGVDKPSTTISASAGTSRSTVFAFTTLIGAPTSAPATWSSSSVSGSFCAEAKAMQGGAPSTTAAGSFLTPLVADLFPVRVDAGAQLERRIHAQAPRRLHLAAVDAHVLHAAVGILGDVLRQRRVGRDVPARRRDRQRKAVQAVARLVELLAGDHDLVAGRVD